MTKNFSSLLMLPVMGATLVALSGCIVIDADEEDLHSELAISPHYGTIKAADITGDTVTVRVSSNGCTTKEFIGTDVRRMNGDRFSVGFYREKEDYCRANLPDGVALSWG